MHRRTVLAAGGAALLAGCIGASSTDGSPSTGTTTDSPAGTGTSGNEFVVSDFEVSTTKVAATERYYLRITDVYSTDAVEREGGDPTIRDVSEIDDPALRATVKEVLDDGKVWREEIPAGLGALADRVDFFTWEADTDPEDTATHWGIEVYRSHPGREPVVEFSAELVDDHVAPDDPGEIAFSLTNTCDRVQTVFSGTVPPFSVLWAEAPDDERALLWRNYTEEGCVVLGEVNGEPAMTRCDIGIMTPIDPGETIEKRYELRSAFDHAALVGYGFDTPGSYTVADTVSYYPDNRAQGPSTNVDWTVEFDLEAL